MARADIGLYITDEVAVMIPKTERAKAFFKREFEMPDDCDGLDVTEIASQAMLDVLPRYFEFRSDKKEPKKIHKCLLH